MSIAGTGIGTDAPTDHTGRRRGRTVPWWAFGLANLVIVLVVSVGSWWLLVDPAWSPLDSYPQPYAGILFWTIIATVWVGFTFEWLGPAPLAQPWRGLVGIALVAVIGFVIPLVIAYGWGAVDPTFAAGRAGGAGYSTAQLFVLFAFFFYVCSAVNANHWPWSRSTRQPWTGLGELTLLFAPTLIVYLLLVIPNQAVWAPEGTALMSVPTITGWVYSVVVVAVVTGLLAENRPWSLARRPAGVAASALIGNVVLGTGLYFVVLQVAKLLMGPSNVTALGPGVTSHAAEFGVCWVFWIIAWANVFGNAPTRFSPAVNILVRVVVTLILAVGTYPLYYFVVAEHVLHEPNAGGTLFGEALGFMDWAVLWMLWYVLFLGSYGLPKSRPEEEPALEEAVHTSDHAPKAPPRSAP